jgi:hypothetical protein
MPRQDSQVTLDGRLGVPAGRAHLSTGSSHAAILRSWWWAPLSAARCRWSVHLRSRTLAQFRSQTPMSTLSGRLRGPSEPRLWAYPKETMRGQPEPVTRAGRSSSHSSQRVIPTSSARCRAAWTRGGPAGARDRPTRCRREGDRGKPSAVVDQKALRFLRKNIPRLAKLKTRHTKVSPDPP